MEAPEGIGGSKLEGLFLPTNLLCELWLRHRYVSGMRKEPSEFPH
jgi:hypothetical protein